jgi:hypothetical protein
MYCHRRVGSLPITARFESKFSLIRPGFILRHSGPNKRDFRKQ